MSQASKHVDWCLNKANKEIEECKKLGKRPKHRGLLKVNPSMEEAKENSVIELREDYTYGVQITVKDETKINRLKQICKELIDITKEIIFK